MFNYENKEELIVEDDDDNSSDHEKMMSKKNVFDQKYLNTEREQEIQQLTQLIRTDQPINDDIANMIMQQLNIMSEMTINSSEHIEDSLSETCSSMVSTISTYHHLRYHPYPPMNLAGHVIAHDRPYADYGHLDRQTLANEFQFNLERPPKKQQALRLNAKSFAITSWTNVSKELVIEHIKDEFGLENIQYICIAEEIGDVNHQRHLHIQIIFREKINRRKPFLDDITQTHCNYQVTQNDRAWNEYMKKEGNYIEFGTFQSVTHRKQKRWPEDASLLSVSSRTTSPSVSSSSTLAAAVAAAAAAVSVGSIEFNNNPLPTAAAAAAAHANTTIRAQAQEKRQYEEAIVKQALDLAEKNIDHAMDLIRGAMPTKFLHHSSW